MMNTHEHEHVLQIQKVKAMLIYNHEKYLTVRIILLIKDPEALTVYFSSCYSDLHGSLDTNTVTYYVGNHRIFD